MFIFLALFPIFAIPAALLSQSIGLPADLASLLVLLAGPGAAWLASRALERIAWFQPLAPNGKLLTVAAITVLIASLATGLQQLIVANPVLGAQADPYVKAALFALTFVASQAAYGRHAERKGEPPAGAAALGVAEPPTEAKG